MAGKLGLHARTYKIENSAIGLYYGVVYGSTAGYCKLPTNDTSIPLGVVDSDERVSDALRSGTTQTGRNIAVTTDGFVRVIAGATCDYGDEMVLCTGGTVKPLDGMAAGTYYILGTAEEAATSVGDAIVVKMNGIYKATKS